MAKSRAQRKAERRAREAAQRSTRPDDPEAAAQHDTQVGKSGEVAEVEAELAMSAAAAEETTDAPARTGSRAMRRSDKREAKEAERRKREEAKKRESEQLARRQKQAVAERKRGGVIGFFSSCWVELKKVQWPDRDTLVQATAVTVIFVAVAAAYLGALDGVFNVLVDAIL